MNAKDLASPNRAELANLIGKEYRTCASILMNTYESGRETTQNSIRFKNLVNQAIEQVGSRSERVTTRLNDLLHLTNDSTFWQNQSHGLALFVGEEFDQLFKLDHTPKEVVYVGEHFYTLPIAAASCGTGSTRVLALSWERARLFSSDGHEAFEHTDHRFPVAMDELVTVRDAESQLQYSTHSTQGGSTNSGASSTAMYHGHGDGEDDIAADRDMYLTRVGRMVADEMYNTSHPLVVIATEEVAGHFAATTEVQIESIIHASPDGLSDQDLHKRMIETSHSLLKRSAADLTEQLGTAISKESGSTELSDIVVQAADGRVETLLLGEWQPQQGSFDRDSRQVQMNENGGTDLVNLAVRETLKAGGTVTQIASDDSDISVAAIYRF
ncbi:hypothetical protein SAMN06265222_11080 [Neorhodopirellula lusitana]|uniref:Chemotaxis protein n=1 Tax=Neorhodopirellula lusitana TaxID=445327 RepID=A0ABY1QCY3_9BACT|nr:hypothetical protein [Neorhodopirellula lusitana]SMP67005.1 hypothetical protein SAMN06265222_11080 [Neorhodopirellula lusitana]